MNKKTKKIPVALTIAGSDSGGGAGIQADLRTFAYYGVYGCSAITAVTAQNPCEVRRVDALPAGAVKAQLESVFDEFDVGSVKTGMLFDSGIIRAVSKFLSTKRKISVVVDPVMVSTSGAVLLKKDAVSAVAGMLFPVAAWVTPNIHEAELLLGRKIGDEEEMMKAAADFAEKWNCGCIVKGGHLKIKGSIKVDAVAYDGGLYRLSSPEIETRAGHGTGCTFSAAIAAGFALGHPWETALLSAKSFVYGSLVESVMPGGRIYAMFPPAGKYSNKVSIRQCGKY
ncbi:MAG: bifunctional hydroxymethylpyrimidine kinase/phosphomethylpyrimidine kinase [Victivallales bacterium]